MKPLPKVSQLKVWYLFRYMDSTLFSLKQVLNRVPATYDYRSMNVVLYQEENWNEVDTKTSSILEVLLPQDTVVIKRPVKVADQPIGYQVKDKEVCVMNQC